MTKLIGQSIGRYHILEQLGQGGMAIVYKAYDIRLERDVAIKVIRTDAFPPAILERVLKRFEREAKALAKLDHPNIVAIYDYGEHEGAPYLVMPYLPGGTLKQRMGKPVSEEEAVRLILPIAQALSYAHEHGILHRDVKPSNILIGSDGVPRLGDFGIGKLLEQEDGHTLTGTGVGVGTPEYMAPEQGLGRNVDARADVYSLGIVLYELVTGRKPYTADTPMAVVVKHLNDPLPRPRSFNAGVSEEMERVLFKALAKKPEDRYEGINSFIKVFEKIKEKNYVNPSLISEKGKIIEQPITYDSIKEISKKLESKKEVNKKSLNLGIVFVVLIALLLSLLDFQTKKNVFLTKPVASDGEILTTTDQLSISTIMPSPITLQTNLPTISIEPTSEFGIGSTREREKDGMIQVYVPAGEFIIEANAEEFDDKKSAANTDFQTDYLDSIWVDQTEITDYLDAFWIDQTEITNSQYAKCVRDGICAYPERNASWTRWDYFGNKDYDDYPVIYGDAYAYCKWVEGRLPTKNEWRKAAQGNDGRVYPWGNDPPNCYRTNFSNCANDTIKVGIHPGGASPYGAFDMAGNVWEIVVSDDNCGYMGGSWFDDSRIIQTTSCLNAIIKNGWLNRIGFRCVNDAIQ